MPYHYITYILEDQNYDRINQCLRQNIHNYNYLCGVMSLMNGKHWSAVLINMKTSVFTLLIHLEHHKILRINILKVGFNITIIEKMLYLQENGPTY
jgi:hypothetical protein